jgi:HlyD family secretion protein
MSVRLAAVALVAIVALATCGPPKTFSPAAAAQAKSKVQGLIDELRGATLPDGIAKTNGRIEATQIDVAAKYAGRLATVTVKEGDEVTAGQVIARISSPEHEAQLRGARAQVLKAKQALAEAEALIAQRKAITSMRKRTWNAASLWSRRDIWPSKCSISASPRPT